MMTKFDSIYRFFVICFFSVFGLVSLKYQHVPTVFGPHIYGEEAMAFGISCLLAAIGYLVLDFRLMKASSAPELD